jgi:hypothetical protein
MAARHHGNVRPLDPVADAQAMQLMSVWSRIPFGGTSVLSLQCLRTLTLGKSLSMVAQW